MENKTSLSSPLQRITVLDALRGFALFGVIIMHMLQHFGIRGPQTEALQFPALDEIVQWIGSNIIMGRFINIFAFLFGLSFFIQMDRAARKDVDFRKRFVWRMIILMAMGLLSHSFYSLEIISLYAFLGLLLIPLYKAKDWVLILIFAFFVLGGPRIIQAVQHNDQVSKTELLSDKEQQPEVQRSRELPEHIKNPSFINEARYNYQERLTGKLKYQFGFIGRGFVTFSLFVLGLFVGRIRFFEKIREQQKQNLKLFFVFVSATIGVVLIINWMPPVNTRMLFRPEGMQITNSLLIVKALEDLNLVFSSAAMTLGFILLYQHEKIKKYLEVLSPYGRTGLTNYIMQGVIGSLLFSLWAFGPIFGGWGDTALFLFGILIYFLQVIMSKYWLKNYLYGPLEWLWRSLTYLKVQPYKKKKPV